MIPFRDWYARYYNGNKMKIIYFIYLFIYLFFDSQIRNLLNC
jgi:hypothetical protein